MNLWQDIRFGVRVLGKNPAFTLTAVGVLALGIGVNSAVFNLVNSLLFRPLAVEQPDRLLNCLSRDTKNPDTYRAFSYPNFVDLRAADNGFSDLAAFRPTIAGLREGDETRRIMLFFVSSDYFQTFRVAPARGRDFTLEEERGAADNRVLIASHQLWRRPGATDTFLGRIFHLNGHPFRVVGAYFRQVARFVPREGTWLSPAGVGAGVLLALALSSLLSTFLYRVSATDPIVFAGSALFLVSTALIACWFPARRASRVDPMIALRYE